MQPIAKERLSLSFMGHKNTHAAMYSLNGQVKLKYLEDSNSKQQHLFFFITIYTKKKQCNTNATINWSL